MGTAARETNQNGRSRLEVLGIVLALATGVVHLALGIGAVPDALGIASVLAALGFAVGVYCYVVDYRRRLILLLGVPFVGGQIVLWYVLNRPASLADVSPLAAVDKPIQAVLVVVLVFLYSRERDRR